MFTCLLAAKKLEPDAERLVCLIFAGMMARAG